MESPSLRSSMRSPGPSARGNWPTWGRALSRSNGPGVGDFARGYDERVRGISSHFVWCNRSKESLTLDVKHPEARNILAKLLAKADVLVQNLAPGAAARLGLSYEALREKHPRLIVCDISGYGSDGPYRDKKAYDLLIQSESGFLSITGTPEAPAKAGISIADISAGMYAYSNILAALIQRGKTGKGCRIDLSLARKHGRMDELCPLIRIRGRSSASSHGRGTRDHRSLRTISRWRRYDGDAWTAERTRVEGFLRACARKAGAGRRPTLFLEFPTHRCPREN